MNNIIQRPKYSPIRKIYKNNKCNNCNFKNKIIQKFKIIIIIESFILIYAFMYR